MSHVVTWVNLRRYDFGYLMKILTTLPLPADEAEFFELLGLYFPNFFDMKYLCKFCDSLHGGLNKLAEQLDVRRIGPQHQAGSDRCGGARACVRTPVACTCLVGQGMTSGVSISSSRPGAGMMHSHTGHGVVAERRQGRKLSRHLCLHAWLPHADALQQHQAARVLTLIPCT